jgi:putative toxin-antitoxin system antitoxin component (TIGR02293 family)
MSDASAKAVRSLRASPVSDEAVVGAAASPVGQQRRAHKQSGPGEGAVEWKLQPEPDRRPTQGSILGLPVFNAIGAIRVIEDGIPFGAIEAMARHTGLRIEELARLADIPPRTLARRRTEGCLDERESERLWRLATLIEKGIDLFDGSTPEALAWLQTPQKALGGAVPLAFARTEPGAREVENLIGRLEHGVFS